MHAWLDHLHELYEAALHDNRKDPATSYIDAGIAEKKARAAPLALQMAPTLGALFACQENMFQGMIALEKQRHVWFMVTQDKKVDTIERQFLSHVPETHTTQLYKETVNQLMTQFLVRSTG